METRELPPAGFESHWDAAYFLGKAEECRRLAALSPDPTLRSALMDLVQDFQAQGEHAGRLAVIAFGTSQ